MYYYYILYCIIFNILYTKFIFYLYSFVFVIYTICLHNAIFQSFYSMLQTVLQSSFYFDSISIFFLTRSFTPDNTRCYAWITFTISRCYRTVMIITDRTNSLKQRSHGDYAKAQLTNIGVEFWSDRGLPVCLLKRGVLKVPFSLRKERVASVAMGCEVTCR